MHKEGCVYLSHLPQSFALFAVDMSLHAGLAPADEYEVPQGESSKRHRYRAVGEQTVIFTYSTRNPSEHVP